MKEISEKLVKFFEVKGLTQADVAKQIGTSKAYVNAILNNRKEIGKKQAEKFENLFGLSSSWLLTGNGQMLLGGQNVIGDNNTATNNNGNHNTTSNTTTNNYRGCGGADTKAAKDISDMGDRITALEDRNDIYTIPLLPISAQGGSLNDFVSSVNLQDCEKIISPIKGADIAITISGDSMADEYPSGSIVLAKRINERAFIDWGKVYVLDTCNGVVVKTLTPSQKEDCVRCVSINPNPIYAPFEVALNDIYGVYRVMLCMAKK